MALNHVPNIFLDLNFILFIRKTCFRIPCILSLLPSPIPTPATSLSLSGIKTLLTEIEDLPQNKLKHTHTVQLSSDLSTLKGRKGGRERRRREGGKAGRQVRWQTSLAPRISMFYPGIQIISARSNFSLSSGFAFHFKGFNLRLHEW